MDSKLSDKKPASDTSNTGDDSVGPSPTKNEPVAYSNIPPEPTPLEKPEEASKKTPGEIPVSPNVSNFLTKALLVLGPLFMLGSLAFSIYTLKIKGKAPEIYVAETGEAREEKGYILEKMPKSPDKITATCQSTGETLTSGSSTSCSDPVFGWQSEARGFFVYFGTESPEENNVRPADTGTFQISKTFNPTSLEKGQTYYLFVQEASEQKNPLWLRGKKATKSFFKYVYR